MPSWNFITNHGAVLTIVSQRPQITGREMSQLLGITERAVLRIVADLESSGYLSRTRQGRTNSYKVNQDLPLPIPMLKDVAMGDLLDALASRSVENVTND
jgi:predicted DNA-binding transcriptional regulator YafY